MITVSKILNIFHKILSALIVLFFAISCEDKNESVLSTGRVEGFLNKAQDEKRNDTLRAQSLDSIIQELKDYPNDTVTRNYYLKAAAGYYNLGFYDKSLSISQKSYELSREAKDTLNMALAQYYTGDSYYNRKNDSAFYYYAQSENLYRETDDLGSLGEVILYKAYVYYDIGEYILCEIEAVKALSLLIKDDNKEPLKKAGLIYNCYNLIATANDGLNNNEESLVYYNRALHQLEEFKRLNVSQETINWYYASCYNNMGGVYVKLGQPGQAIKLYNDALNYIDIEDDASLYAKLLNNLAHAKFKAGDMDELPGLYNRSLQIRDSINNISGIIASKIHLGEFYAYKKDTLKAIQYLEEAYDDAKRIKSHFEILNSLKLLSELDIGNSAFYSARYIRVSDSLQEEAKRNKDKYVRIEYETERLKDEKEELIKRNGFIIGISAVVLLFVGAVFIIYYLNSRNKKLLLIQEQQKANEEIYQLMFEQQSKIDKAREEEKSRIAMELHDGILNNIYAVRLNLEFINKKGDEESVAKRKEYIKELQSVESEIRAVSHDLNRNAVFQDKSFKDVLELVITSQKNKFRTSFEAEVDDEIDWDAMPNIQKVNLYRIIQEGLQNINKYSKAKNAFVKVKKGHNNIGVVIIDDGVGFDPEKIKGGIGLKNLKKRSSVLNGKLSISSSPGEGAKIEVIFPN